MKKIIVLAAACLVLLAGCNGNTPSASLSPKNNNGGAQAADAPYNNAADNKGPAASSSADADIEIKEKMFIAQTNDIYLNFRDYLGKTIKYEGIFDVYNWKEEFQIDDEWEAENIIFNSVIRYGPGCCGNDGNVGFEVVWDGEYPEENDWVEVIGTLESYDNNGILCLRLNLSSLTVLPVRGAENVSQ